MFGRKVIEALIASHEREREAWRSERRALLNRIQAPERAAYEEIGEPSDHKLYVGPDDDKAFEDYELARKNGEAV